MLMYRGSAESYPCRTDLLCFVKREYQLIGESDFEEIKNFIKKDEDKKGLKKAYRRKSIWEIHAFDKRGKEYESDEL